MHTAPHRSSPPRTAATASPHLLDDATQVLQLPRPRLADEHVEDLDVPEIVLPETLLLEVVLTEADPVGWQERALCAQTDPEAFFPEKGGSTREAKRVCLSCEVRVECLDYALQHDERFGIWGGLSERERRRVKRDAV